MSRHIFACSAAGVFALALGIAAQTPPAGGAQTPPAGGGQTPPAGRQTQPPAPPTTGAVAAPGGSATIEGCLMRESDVRKSGVGTTVEKATGTEDYILASSKVLKGTAPASASSGAAAGTPTGTSGAAATGLMFDVRGLDQAKLKPFEGKRVEIDGTFADAERSATAGAAQDLVDIRATAVRASTSTAACPAAK